jgi:hypothetical protein
MVQFMIEGVEELWQLIPPLSTVPVFPIMMQFTTAAVELVPKNIPPAY